MDRTNDTHHFAIQALVRKIFRRGVSFPMITRLIASVFALFVTASATAAVIEINGNQIQTAGALNATVDYTSEKLSINIPGVTIILDCGAEVPAASCTLTTASSAIDQPALIPTFGSSSSLDSGFTVQVSNYDSAYSWSAISSLGSASINGAGLVTVSGLTSGQSATVTVTTTRSGYDTGSAMVAGTAKTADQSLGAALVPQLAIPTSTTDGFTVQVGNYDGAYKWTVETSVGTADIDGSGLVTVSGLSAGQTATVRISTSRSGYADGAAEKTGTAKPQMTECLPGMDCYETCAPENRPTANLDEQARWDQACADYEPTTNNNVEPETDECKAGMDCYETCAPENRPASNESGAQDEWDQACADYDPTTNNNVDPETDNCPGIGYDCYKDPVDNSGNEGDGEDPIVERDFFPTGAARVVKRAGDADGNFDFGSAGRNGGSGRVYWEVEKGVVSVAGLTLSEEEGSETIKVSFGVTSDQPTASLHYWLSDEPDGEAIQYCSYVGYAQSTIRFSVDDAELCQLTRGEAYYLNLALCDSEEGDIECRSVQALSAERAAVLAVRSTLIDR